MAFQLGNLGYAPAKLVEQDKARSGNYNQLFDQMNRNQQSLGQREDRATLNKLGSVKSDAIMDGQGGSPALQGIRDAQAKALEAKDIPLYDKLTGDLKAQMGIESAEAKADPFGKNQMARDKFNQQKLEEQAMKDPRVNELMNAQKKARLDGQRLINSYVNAKSPEEKALIEGQYFDLVALSDQAGSELGSNPALSGYHHTKMPNFFDMIEKAVKGKGAQDLSVIEKETKEYGRDKIKVESEAIGDRVKLSQQKQRADLSKMKEERGYRAHNQITKVLKDSGLSEPFVYDSIIEDAQFAVDNKNIFTAVKLLSNVIEPGLSVTEGEVEGYTVGGTSKLNKFLQKMGGAGESDMNRILDLLKGIARNRKRQSQIIIDRGGERVEIPKTKKTPTKVLNFDPATGKFS